VQIDLKIAQFRFNQSLFLVLLSKREFLPVTEGAPMSAVLLVVMPFGAIDAPQTGVSTIQAELKSRGMPCDINYLNLAFAQGIGIDAYNSIGLTSGEMFAGEWLFARTLFSDQQLDADGYMREILVGSRILPQQAIDQIRQVAPRVPEFLDYCMRTIPWERYALVGFTSMFEQNLASLALAWRIKQRYPNILITMGGANCFGSMGVQLHRSFTFLDYVFTGEADLDFPELVLRLAGNRSPDSSIKGCVRREGEKSIESGPAQCLEELDQLPYPDYDDFFSQYAQYRLPRSLLQYLLLETSRGCWWGHKNQCRFCGINQNEIPFRTKSPQRALDEMQHLSTRYGITQLMTVDNILDLKFFKTLVPELRRRQFNFTLFYESKANLRKNQVRLLAEAGILGIQPGIESFSRNVLKLMHKGVSPLQNAALLKWCRQYRITPLWNLLFGIPGENSLDYQQNLRFVRALTHLEPPMGFGRIRLERFSPLYNESEKFGLRNLRAAKPYRYLYPFDAETLDEIAYYFDFDYDGKEKIDQWSKPLETELGRWKTGSAPFHLEVVQHTEDGIVVRDTRPTRILPRYYFKGLEKEVIRFCDQPRSFAKIHKFLEDQKEPIEKGDASWLQDFLDHLVRHRLMIRSQESYLSVILPDPVGPAMRPGCSPGAYGK
jgi:ribosomal peptide maturation radical SAM protein 1